MEETQRQLRARERAGRMVLRRTELDASEPDQDLIEGEEALSLVSRLTRECWSLSGQVWPQYRRTETPYRFVADRRP